MALIFLCWKCNLPDRSLFLVWKLLADIRTISRLQMAWDWQPIATVRNRFQFWLRLTENFHFNISEWWQTWETLQSCLLFTWMPCCLPTIIRSFIRINCRTCNKVKIRKYKQTMNTVRIRETMVQSEATLVALWLELISVLSVIGQRTKEHH